MCEIFMIYICRARNALCISGWAPIIPAIREAHGMLEELKRKQMARKSPEKVNFGPQPHFAQNRTARHRVMSRNSG